MDKKFEFGNGAKVRRLLVEELRVDSDYQRPQNKPQITRITQGFDPRQFGILEVSKRPGGWYAVFDGQHRLAAARQLGLKDVLCLVHENLTPRDESYLFARLQLDRKTLRPFDRFRAQLFARDPQALEIDQIARDYGFRIVSGNTGPYSISAVTSLEAIYRRGGGPLLRDVLGMIVELWEGDSGATTGQFLVGVSTFWVAFGPKISETHKDRLRRVSPITFLRRSLEYQPTSGTKGGYGPGVALKLQETAKMKKMKPVAYTKLFGAPGDSKKGASKESVQTG